MTEGDTTNGTNGTVQVSDLDSKIITQIEYYFGDYNLPRDKFLQEQIKEDDGWVKFETMTKFKRLAALTTDLEVIASAIKKSSNELLEVDDTNTKLRRCANKPLPLFDDQVKEETTKRTIYCKGFPKDSVLDPLLEFFKQYGPVETVHMRNFFDHNKKTAGFKGSVLVVFPTEEKAKEFNDLSEVKYNGTHLLRKWYADYQAEKAKEMEEYRARKEAKQKARQDEQEEEEKQIDLPKGTFLHFSGIAEGVEVTREDIKEALGDHAETCAFVDFSKGQSEGFLRFKEAESNKTIHEKIEGKLKIRDMELAVRVVEGEEEEAQLQKMREARGRARVHANNKKRRGGGHGGFNKRRRN